MSAKGKHFFLYMAMGIFYSSVCLRQDKKKSHGPMPKACELVTNQYADAMEWNKNPIH
jgi:hypothetical protein